MRFLDIGTLAARSGTSAATLRYYEEIGLITSTGRHGLRRQFGSEALVRLSLIGLGKAAGFSLTQISGMIGRDGIPDLPRDSLRAQADALDARVRDLTALARTLRHAADCSAPSHLECPTFRRLLRVVLRRGHRTRHAAPTPR
ncbi:helix-turn-helix domain-containing protein [Tabrizicola sp.]|uniref:helix-turn-helix domain-containing protein n=1 Tax=Tabrizicola sp. TaxID=2005166 RepID=UPI00286BF22C|nr:helix-turn-helix domain-containing protein [Tabrizicola sp.]